MEVKDEETLLDDLAAFDLGLSSNLRVTFPSSDCPQPGQTSASLEISAEQEGQRSGVIEHAF
jgi:hypothetical protein